MADHPDDVTLSDWLSMRLIAALVLVVTSIGAWNALLGWDDRHDADGSGPYDPWQVAVLVCILGVLAVSAGWLGFPLVAVLCIPVALGFAAFQDWGPTDETGLFMIGVIGLTAASFLGVAVAAGTAAILSPRHRSAAARH